MPYYPPARKGLVPAFKKHNNIELVLTSVKTVTSLLGSTKDPIHFFKKRVASMKFPIVLLSFNSVFVCRLFRLFPRRYKCILTKNVYSFCSSL